MLKLVQNEWIKIFRQVGTYVMIGLVVLLVIGSGVLTKYYGSTAEPNTDWKQDLNAQNEGLRENLKHIEGPAFNDYYLQQQLAINEYRLDHDLPPDYSSNVWSFISESSSFISFAGLFVIIIAAGIVANEFTWGTIKVLLIKPFSRWKILLSKYITVVLFLLLTLLTLFVTASIVGTILFGTGEASSNIHLAYSGGVVIEQSLLLYLIKSYLLNSLSILLLATMAFMISSVFRVSGLAIGISIFLLNIWRTHVVFVIL